MSSSALAVNALKEARKKHSQKELATFLDVTTRTIGRWENGEDRPPFMIVPALHQALQQLSDTSISLDTISRLDKGLLDKFSGKIVIEQALSRKLVSFQANKEKSNYRWFKYKEGFSYILVKHLLQSYGIESGKVLDPFAGSGTALFAASELGLESEGIELLPIGQHIIETRRELEQKFSPSDFKTVEKWIRQCPWNKESGRKSLNTLRITNGAYPSETLAAIEHYSAALKRENKRVQEILFFALLCILESISYTRKDGQYLRWDYRSGRRQGTKIFNKGRIIDFDSAITAKLSEIMHDIRGGIPDGGLFATPVQQASVKLHTGSCLNILPTLPAKTYQSIVTSPPYCNRYDYTRTYALELALLGIDEKGLVDLRQQMLSCTVENRAKDLLVLDKKWGTAIKVADTQALLQTILKFMEGQKMQGHLNNNGIPRMLRGYFYEMACVIYECARVLKPGGIFIMVNDNVRYAGASISVDLILSDMACNLGFNVDKIMVLPNGKGNSSQQMEVHGKEALRKCVYVWRKK